VLIIAIWLSIVVPVVVSFEPAWAEDKWYEYLDMGANILFCVDILIAFNTSYYDVEGEEVKSRFRIAKRYMAGSFLIDALSSFPFTIIGGKYSA
jgi:hypothetical protein